jgi:predicted ATPase/DNA-binding CsgD family transcriptional regulator
VTFLFTDIEDSTRRWDEDPSDMADALRVHDAIVRGAIDRHRGYVFGTGGDGFCAAFPTAADAASAAIESQEALRDETTIDFAVRMGLHTGEAVERDRNYFGSEVNRAARLMSIAHGGQVLVSDATEVLLRDRVGFRPLGEHRLRGLRARMSVFQVLADGLPADFPVLRSVDALTGNLPRQLSSVIGRDEIVDDVAELVRGNRLVTLTGVGGVGKTRLAFEIGAEVAAEFPDGVWLIELASVTDPGFVPAAIATVLGITPRGDTPLVETVAETLAGRELLLVVDNCEHVLGAAGSTVGTILGRSGRTRIVATSREALAVPGEVTVAVPPLPCAGGAASEAVALFVDRARAVRADFGLNDVDTADAVSEICATVDGLPLGIELAASRMAAMSAVEVRDRLADRFRLLQGSTPGPERQLTLRHAVDWSYGLLTDDERALLRTTSVFAGSFDLAALATVAVDTDEVDVLRHLDSLVRKSLVTADHSAPRTRYALFETIRQFAEDRLRDHDDLETTRDRHAAYFASEAVDHWAGWEGPGWRTAVDWVETELGNLRVAYRWSASRGDVEVATDVAAHAALMGFSVQLFETLAWAEELLESATAADVPRLPRLYTAAGYACFAGRAEAARANARRATELERDARYESCPPGYASFIEALGAVYCGDLDRYLELTAEVAQRYGRDRGYGLSSYVDGLQSAGRTQEALAITDESVTVARELGNPYWIAYSLWIAGMAYSHTEPRRALAAWDEGMTVVRGQRVQFFEGFIARDAARLHTSDGEPAAALGLFADAITEFQRAGNVPQLVITLASVPALFVRLGRPEPAATVLGALAAHPTSAHHVPELAELSGRIERELGPKRTEQLAADGAALDLAGAAVYARQQIDVARRDPSPPPAEERPGGLSRREVEVLRLVADGKTASAIAAELFISKRTAEHHIGHIYTKIGVANRAAATRWAVQHRLVEGTVRA